MRQPSARSRGAARQKVLVIRCKTMVSCNWFGVFSAEQSVCWPWWCRLLLRRRRRCRARRCDWTVCRARTSCPSPCTVRSPRSAPATCASTELTNDYNNEERRCAQSRRIRRSYCNDWTRINRMRCDVMHIRKLFHLSISRRLNMGYGLLMEEGYAWSLRLNVCLELLRLGMGGNVRSRRRTSGRSTASSARPSSSWRRTACPPSPPTRRNWKFRTIHRILKPVPPFPDLNPPVITRHSEKIVTGLAVGSCRTSSALSTGWPLPFLPLFVGTSHA